MPFKLVTRMCISFGERKIFSSAFTFSSFLFFVILEQLLNKQTTKNAKHPFKKN